MDPTRVGVLRNGESNGWSRPGQRGVVLTLLSALATACSAEEHRAARDLDGLLDGEAAS
jgi:hypothetical protein